MSYPSNRDNPKVEFNTRLLKPLISLPEKYQDYLPSRETLHYIKLSLGLHIVDISYVCRAYRFKEEEVSVLVGHSKNVAGDMMMM